MKLHSEAIQLRAIEPEDLDALMRWENDPDYWHLSGTLAPYSRQLLRQYLANARQDIFEARQLRLIMEHRQDEKAIGTLDIYDFEPYHERAGVGILIGESQYRGGGLAHQALDLLINYAFSQLPLKQLYCTIQTENKVSKKLFESHGFELRGQLKRWIRRGENFEDVNFYQLLKSDHKSR